MPLTTSHGITGCHSKENDRGLIACACVRAFYESKFYLPVQVAATAHAKTGKITALMNYIISVPVECKLD